MEHLSSQRSDRVDSPLSIEVRQCPQDSILVEVFFDDGPLGVTLHRGHSGIVTVMKIIEETQAVNMDVADGDELWEVGDRFIGETPMEKAEWGEVVEYIKTSDRPLRVVFRRHFRDELENGTQTPYEMKSSVNDFEDGGDAVLSADSLQLQQSLSTSSQLDPLPTSNSQGQGEPCLSDEESRRLLLQDEETRRIHDLEQIASCLQLKEKEKPVVKGFAGLLGRRVVSDKSAVGPTSLEYLLSNPTRRVVKVGSLAVGVKGALWNTSSRRQFFLFSDLLLIAAPNVISGTFTVETEIDLQTCKLSRNCYAGSLQEHLAATGSGLSGQASIPVEQTDLMFLIICPAGVITINCKSIQEKSLWVESIFDCVCDCVGDHERVIGWRHQYMLGTIHSAVMSRDEFKVREMLTDISSGILSSGSEVAVTGIDEVDADGFTALHLACILRMHGIIRALHDAGADVTAKDRRGYTALHWAALHLDDQAVTILCSHIFCPDIEDGKGLTPLYLACVEGRDLAGKSDPVSLGRCLNTLLGLHSDPNIRDSAGKSPLHYLAAGWQFEAMDLLLQRGAEVWRRCDSDRSYTPLHFAVAAAPLKHAVGVAARLLGSSHGCNGGEDGDSHLLHDMAAEKLVYANGPRALASLLKYGARPNSKDSLGMTPLQILGERELYWGIYLLQAVCILVEAGARLDDSAACNTLRAKVASASSSASTAASGVSSARSIEEAIERRNQKPALNADLLGLE